MPGPPLDGVQPPAPAAGHDRRAHRLSSATLVGRWEELESLLHAVAQPPTLILLDGEAGVGKTRLVRELMTHPSMTSAQRLVGHCHDLREPFPLGPLIEALRETSDALCAPGPINPVVGAVRPLLPELANALPPALEPLGDPRAERHRLFRGLLELIRALGPTLLVLEDLHWIDRGSHEFLRFLVAQLPDELRLVLTYRPEGSSTGSPIRSLLGRLPADAFAAEVSLDPLDREEVLELVGAILERDDVPEELSAYLHERTLGLPFAVEEVVRLLVHRREHLGGSKRWTPATLEALGVPSVLRDSILERLSLLGLDAQAAARAAAVLGRPASEELVAAVARLSTQRARTALAEALLFAVLRESEAGRYTFRHALWMQAVYEAIPSPERRELHRRAAGALEEAGEPLPLAQLARHYKAGDRPREWVRSAEAAADRALELGDDAAAVELLRDVLLLPGQSPALLARLAVKLARAGYTGVAFAEIVPILRHTLEEGSLPAAVRGELRLRLVVLLLNNDVQADVHHQELVRALEELEGHPALAAEAMANLAVPLSYEGRLSEHLAWMERAIEAAGRARDEAVRARLVLRRTAVRVLVGDPRAWADVLALPTATTSMEDERELAKTYGNLAYASAVVGHYGRSETFGRRALALAEHGGDPHMRAALGATTLVRDWATGRWEGLAARAQELAEAVPELQPTVVETRLVRGLLLLAGGHLKPAMHELTWVCDACATGYVLALPAAAGGLSRLLLARGDAEAAQVQAGIGLAPARRKEMWVLAADVAAPAVDALLACGRRQDAEALVLQLGEGLSDRDSPAGDAALAFCRAKVAAADARVEEATRLFGAAEAAFHGMPRPYEAAQAREARGSHELAAAGHQTGAELLHGALEQFAALGAQWDAGRVRRTLRSHGLSAGGRPGRKSYGNRLSPREQEVAQLAGVGHTNRQIAAMLFLSPRTVEEHVANALRKLGVHSRDALARLDGDVARKDP